MFNSFVALAAVTAWDVADCQLAKNYGQAIEAQKAERRAVLAKYCGTLWAIEGEPALCADWRAIQEGGSSATDQLEKAQRQFFDVAEVRCQP